MLSSDQFGGFPCFNNLVVEKYLRRSEVLEAIHVNVADLSGTKWEECSDDIDRHYIRETRDTFPVFTRIVTKAATINPPLKLRFLIYNGDADGVCNFLGGEPIIIPAICTYICLDEWFVEEFTNKTGILPTNERQQWYYQKEPQFRAAPVGFFKTYGNDNVMFDLVTVSGAGHYVPTYRYLTDLLAFTYNLHISDLNQRSRCSVTFWPISEIIPQHRQTLV
jgi:hypothetical protein